MLTRVNNFFRTKWHYLLIIFAAIFFFLATSSFYYYTQKGGFYKWLSPDETANYTFAKLYGQEGRMSIYEGYNLYTNGIMYPRSFRSDFGYLKPVSFLGIILVYGKIVSWTSFKILPFLTPAIGAIGLIFFYLLVRKFYGSRNALLSSLLLACFPAYVYYSARSMFHNVLFMVLLVIGFYFSIKMAERKRYSGYLISDFRLKKIKEKIIRKKIIGAERNSLILSLCDFLYSALAGGFIGLALITRTSELLWIGPILFLAWIFNIRKIGLYRLIIFLSFLVLAFVPVFYWNNILYGSTFSGGYPEMNQSIASIASASSDLVATAVKARISYAKELLVTIKNDIFRFGFHPRDSWLVFKHYFIQMFPWIFWPAILGFIFHLIDIRNWKKRHYLYYFSLFILTFILAVYYGSWKFHDNPDPNSFTIGNSYTRYWLPIYLGVMPLVSLAIINISQFLLKPFKFFYNQSSQLSDVKHSKYFYINSDFLQSVGAGAIQFGILIIIFFVSTAFVVFGSEEGLMYGYKQQLIAREEYQQILSLTEKNSTVITRYHDKLYFPERKVIVGSFDDPNMIREYSNLVDYLPVYYFNFTFPAKDFQYLNARKLRSYGLMLAKIKQTSDDFTLYKFNRVKSK